MWDVYCSLPEGNYRIVRGTEPHWQPLRETDRQGEMYRLQTVRPDLP